MDRMPFRLARRSWLGHSVARGLSLGLAVVLSTAVSAQELVPASYTPAPYGVNVLSLATMYNTGDISFDPALPIDVSEAKILGSTLGYARTLNIAGRSANVGVIVPYVLGDLEGLYLGEPATAERSGIGDMAFRGAINLYGGSAMSPKEFSTYRPGTLDWRQHHRQGSDRAVRLLKTDQYRDQPLVIQTRDRRRSGHGALGDRCLCGCLALYRQYRLCRRVNANAGSDLLDPGPPPLPF